MSKASPELVAHAVYQLYLQTFGSCPYCDIKVVYNSKKHYEEEHV